LYIFFTFHPLDQLQRLPTLLDGEPIIHFSRTADIFYERGEKRLKTQKVRGGKMAKPNELIDRDTADDQNLFPLFYPF